MDSWTSLVTLIAGSTLGAAIAWLLLRGIAARLRIELQAARDAEAACEGEVEQARGQIEAWRGRHQSEQLERARFETEARRVVGLEAELQEVRSRAEALAGETSALQSEARRVPALEERVNTLVGEATDLKAGNVQLQTQLHEQSRGHAEKIAVLTEVRGEIERDLKGVTADALRANQGTFLQLANEIFEKHKAGAEADLETRKEAVRALVIPLQESLQAYRQQIDQMEQARSQSYGMLSAELKGVVEAQYAVRSETSKPPHPSTSGYWQGDRR